MNMGNNDGFGRNKYNKTRKHLWNHDTSDDTNTSNTRRVRNTYQRGTNIPSMCRVCLTQSTNTMFDLTMDIEDITDSCEKLPIIQALQIVTSSTIILHPKCPQYICPVCMSVLKMAYSFIIQFKKSQATLERKLNVDSYFDNEENFKIELEPTKQIGKSSEVELIVDEKKYDLGDIMYVEEHKVGELKFDGFLNNLGKEITATFAGEKREQKLNNDHAITILMKDKNCMVPVRELQIDETTNEIKFEVQSDDNISVIESEHRSSNNIQHSADDTQLLQSVTLQDLETEDDKTGNVSVGRESLHDHTYTVSKPFNFDDCDDIELIDSLIIGGESISKRSRRVSKRNQETPCGVCGTVFPNRREMDLHKRRVHSRDRIYKCRHCEKQFITKSAYTTHTQRHLGKRFTCELCGRSYYTKQHLKQHFETHLDKNIYLCTVCGKACKQRSGLEYHMLLHSDEKKYQCAYCAMQFRMLGALRRHEQNHTGEKPFQCRFCDKPFSTKSGVAAHENIHTGFRPYLCIFCRKGFTKTCNLKVHLFRHGGTHACNICNKSFVRNAILLWHYQIYHKQVDVDLSGCKLSDYFVRSREQVCVNII
ncbi:unnamed protein product [Callosobruchus maculatus]|uniref:Protein krueppel n=1 Tax=Callosobruchus maculatus TaxID=64391 RepID=A0A653C8T4_CALMS|nr:unnamed protein product [Callosobruchus maculatus]